MVLFLIVSVTGNPAFPASKDYSVTGPLVASHI